MDSDALRSFALRQKYLVIDDQGSAYVFGSLRDIAKTIEIDHTTVSKKLKSSPNGELFSSRGENQLYYIRKVCNSP